MWTCRGQLWIRSASFGDGSCRLESPVGLQISDVFPLFAPYRGAGTGHVAIEAHGHQMAGIAGCPVPGMSAVEPEVVDAHLGEVVGGVGNPESSALVGV